GPTCTQIGFEPDQVECDRLRQTYANESAEATRKIVVPVALWDKAETRTLYITKDPDASSCYRPNDAFLRRLPDPTTQQVVATLNVDVIPLDKFELPITGSVDVIKADVQGGELDVLRGATRHLDDGVLAIIAEQGFTPQYVDQPWY